MFANSPAEIFNTDNSGKVPENPTLLRHWFKQNLRSRPIEKMITLAEALVHLEKHRGNNRRYLACLDVAVDFINPVAIDASRLYIGQPPPIPTGSVELSERLGDLWYQLAQCYKASVLDAARDEGRDNDAIETAHACYAAMYSYGRTLFSAYEVYRNKPTDVLSNVHQLYLYAQTHELLTLGQKSMIADFDGIDTILDTYKRILLLDLADPYQMPFKMAAKADDMLTRLVDFASLRQAPLTDEIKGIFLIDPSQDQAGIPQLSQPREPLKPDCQLLCTLPLIARVHSHIDLLLSTGAGVWVNPEKSARQVDYINMLRALVLKLGVQPIRKDERIEADKDCNIVVGAQRLTLLIHNRLPSIGRSEANEIDAVITRAANAKSPPAKTVETETALTQRWIVIDETVAGMQLEKETLAHQQLSVGEIIGVDLSSRKRTGWIVGIIRWIKNQDDSRGNLGLLKLGWPAVPVSTRRPGDSGSQIPAVLLSESEELRRGHSLVMPKGYYKSGDHLQLTLNEQQFTVLMGDLIVASPTGDCFEFTMLETDGN